MGGTATVGWSELARVPWQESVIVPESLQLCSLYDSRVFITKLQSEYYSRLLTISHATTRCTKYGDHWLEGYRTPPEVAKSRL